jgi:peptidoglycan/LPS O-acetylase OafA/YrhL
MRISILFPALALLIFRIRPQLAILLAASLSLLALATAHGQPHQTALYSIMITFHYAAFFVLGILLATHLAAISTWYQSLSRLVRAGIFAASFVLYNESSRILDHADGLSADIALEWGVAIGAVGFIITAINSQTARRFLNSAVPAFLGRISYSLYLIHAPVLLALTFGIHNRLSAWAQFPIYLAATIAAAYLFCVCVEEPFTRMGQRLGRPKHAAAPA